MFPICTVAKCKFSNLKLIPQMLEWIYRYIELNYDDISYYNNSYSDASFSIITYYVDAE